MSAPEVMLASRPDLDPERTIDLLARQGWFFELKFDGIRAVITRTSEGSVRITNRRGADITLRYPDVVETWSVMESFTGVVDGEIIVTDGLGRPDFTAAHLRDAQSTVGRIRRLAVQYPAVLMPFDVLERDGEDLRALPYRQRRAALEAMLSTTVPLSSTDGAAMWAFVRQNGLEGLIAKRPDAAYRPGRQKAWVKIKSTRRVSALVGGIVPGKGSRGEIGALELYLYDADAGALRPIGQVGSGMSSRDMAVLRDRAATATPTVVEVEYLEVAPSGVLRMPVFKGIRNDVDPLDCRVETLIAS
jgi:bifunctional non-homologous end joining protein LigD